MKRKRGRPRLGAAAKTEVARIRMTADELAELKHAARAKGMTISELLMRPWRRREG